MEKRPENCTFMTLFIYAKEHMRCDFAYRGAHTAPLRDTRDSKGAQLLGARLCLQSLVRLYRTSRGPREAACHRCGQRWFAWDRQIKPVLESIGFIFH